MEDKEYTRLLKRISANLKMLRNKLKITQEGMADLGFNYRYYQKLESGSYSFNLHTLYRLAKVFKVDLKDLLK